MVNALRGQSRVAVAYPQIPRPVAAAAAGKIAPMKSLLCLISVCFLAIAGCQHNDPGPRGAPQTADRPSQTTVVVEGSAAATDSLDKLVSDVQTAKTAQAEADALRQLRKYETEHGMTYATRSFRTYDNAVVADPSVSHDPVRTEVTIFRGRDTVRTFQFVPKDNRNLSVMGE